MRCFLGIDTSCYTCSAAIVDENEQLVAETRNMLDVPPGKRGLSQAEGVYQHIRKIPALVERLCTSLKPAGLLAAVAVSTAPRDREDSYMPVFKVGEAVARSIAAASALPLFFVSHQVNHILAGRWSAAGPAGPRFLAVHLSGGTTELHEVDCAQGLKLRNLGGTMDLHAGQFVDRVGVALGLPFPAGSPLEKLALQCAGTSLSIPSRLKDNRVSFSGPETQAQRLIQAGNPQEEIALAVFLCIANSLEKLVLPVIKHTGLKDILIVGGVAGNSIIRARLCKRLMHPAVGARLFFAEPVFSRDNAVGSALWACRQFRAAGSSADGN